MLEQLRVVAGYERFRADGMPRFVKQCGMYTNVKSIKNTACVVIKSLILVGIQLISLFFSHCETREAHQERALSIQRDYVRALEQLTEAVRDLNMAVRGIPIAPQPFTGRVPLPRQS